MPAVTHTSNDEPHGSSDLPVRLPITLRELAELMGIGVAQLIFELRARMGFNAYASSMELPPDVVTAVARRFGFSVRFVKRGR